MPTFITLATFTDQGIRTIKDSPHRAEAVKALAAKMGVEWKSIHWTQGAYDLVTVTEGSEEANMALLLAIGAQGNVRTQVLRAYSAAEMQKIIGQMPK